MIYILFIGLDIYYSEVIQTMTEILRINLRTKEIDKEQVPFEYLHLGGRGITSTIISNEVNPTINPLGSGNKLVIAPGLLSGTPAPCSGRISVGAKSPLTGGIKESNGGGVISQKIAKLGYKAIILEDAPVNDDHFILKISKDGVEFLAATEYLNKGTYEVSNKLRKNFGKNIGIMVIGPAGERLLPIAGIAVTDIDGKPCRYCARGGLGAVMGSKHIKAIIIDDTDAPGVDIANKTGFNAISRDFAKYLIQNRKVLTIYGTSNLVEPINSLGCLPTRNFTSGSFEGYKNICGETMKQTIEQRGGKISHPCHPGCVIRCSNVYNSSDGKYLTSSLEFETIALMGSNCGIDDLDAIAYMDFLCDDFGIDTMEVGDTIAVAMEAKVAQFGSSADAIKLIEEIKKDTYLGKILGQGCKVAGKVLRVNRIPTVKGQGISGYDPRGLKGTGVTYATSPMGADHTAGNCLPGRVGFTPEAQRNIDPHSGEGKAELSRDIQIMTTVCDILGICFFAGIDYESIKKYAEFVNLKCGFNYTANDLLEMSRNVIKTEILFNRKAGFSSQDDRLPEFFYNEKLPPYGLTFDVSEKELEKIINDFVK